MSFLDKILGGIRTILSGGSAISPVPPTPPSVLNFTNGTAVYNPATGNVDYTAPAGGGVSSVTGTAPIASSGGATPAISIGAATGGAAGSMSAADKTKLDSFVLTSPAQGDVLYFNGTNWVELAPGTSGQFLKTLGAGANPLWATPAGGSVDLGSLLSQNRVAHWAAGFNGNNPTGFLNCNLTIAGIYTPGTQPTDTPPPSEPLSSTPRAQVFTNATTTFVGMYDSSNYTQTWRGNATGLGGFKLWTRFGLDGAPTTATITFFAGLTNVKGFSMPSVVDYTTQTTLHSVGVAFSESMTGSAYNGNWRIVSCDGSATTNTDSGLPIIDGHLYELQLNAAANASSVAWTLLDITASTSASGTITTHLPGTTTFLNWMCGWYATAITGNFFASVSRYTLETGQ